MWNPLNINELWIPAGVYPVRDTGAGMARKKRFSTVSLADVFKIINFFMLLASIFFFT
jgi:hypothetical protein